MTPERDKGFVRFDKLNKNEKVAQYENGEITYVKQLRYIEKETDEYVSFKYKNIEIKTTKNHNMVYIDENGKEQIRPAKDFLELSNVVITICFSLLDNKISYFVKL